ncbi:MAG TPA: HD-GYP domain-containing protein [Terriglobia bacterium]|nr:HD-GYP domain-containing protein [Terriglobia bacterium]
MKEEMARRMGSVSLATPGWRRPVRTEILEEKVIQEQLRQVKETIVYGLHQLLDLKDLNTGVHSTRLAEWAVRVAEALGVDESYQYDVEVAALLHDIGKIGVPDAILNKPGRLDAEERAVIDRHPEYGWAVLRLLPGFERVSLFVLHHHERVDGKGYPAGLQGEEIPLGSRIVCVVDCFDAMVSDRCYRPALSLDESVRRLQAGSGTQWDAEIVRLFLPLALQELSEVSKIVEPPVLASSLIVSS